jgi:hypothetical protein
MDYIADVQDVTFMLKKERVGDYLERIKHIDAFYNVDESQSLRRSDNHCPIQADFLMHTIKTY